MWVKNKYGPSHIDSSQHATGGPYGTEHLTNHRSTEKIYMLKCDNHVLRIFHVGHNLVVLGQFPNALKDHYCSGKYPVRASGKYPFFCDLYGIKSNKANLINNNARCLS